jgi:hypothetical protein
MSNYSGPYLAPNGLPWLSASQVEGFADCERKWGLRYLKKLKHQDPSAALGARIHEIAEAWLKTGTPPDETEALTLPDKYHESGQWTYYPGQIFKSGMHMLKHAVAHTPKIEGFFRFKSNVSHEIYWQGAKDLSWVSDRPWVGDHKSSKNPKRYGKNAKGLTPGWQAEEAHAKLKGNSTRLLCDTQAMLYSYEAQETHGAKDNGLGWFYYPTRPSNTNKPNAVEVIAPRDHVLEQVARIEGIAKRTLQMYKEKPDPRTLPFNREMCDGFGGCPYKETEHCDAHQLKLTSFFGESNMANDSELFMNFVNTKFAPVGAPPPPPVPVMSAPPPPVPVMSAPPPPPPVPLTMGVEEFHQKHVRPLTEESTDNRTHEFLAQTIGVKAAERIIGQVKAESVLPPPPAPHAPPVFIDRTPRWEDQAGATNNIDALTAEMNARLANRPLVERGTINPLEAPLYAPASPEEAAVMTPVVDTSEKAAPDVLDTMDRTALKALNIRLGLCTESSRFQEPKLRANVREYAQTHNFTVESIIRGDVTFNEIVYTGVMPRGQNVDTSTPPVYVSSGLPPIEDCQFRGEEANRDIDTNIALSMEEREAVQAASQGLTPISITPGTVQRNFDSELKKQEIRDIVRSELERFFAERFGR